MSKSTHTSGYGDVLAMKKTLERTQAEKLPITMYGLRQWIWTGAVPARKVNRVIYIYWPNLMNFLVCADGAGEAQDETALEG